MNIYIYTPQGLVTGGVELLHQLCKELNTYKDIDAYIWYQNQRVMNIPKAYFDEYKNLYAVTDCPPKGSVLIFPESWAKMLNEDRFKDYTKAIYFESVDYYIQWVPRNQYLVFPKDTIFLAQSWYAYTWLQDKTGIEAIMVTDYLNDEFMDADLSKPRKRQILYNPKKGLDVTKKIMAELPDETFIPIVNMTAREIKNLMEESMLYIDFGNHPGKDRIPREAAMCGCCVITNRKGSADNLIDVPIPSEYKFHECFMNLAISQMKFVLDNYNGCKYDFDDYREIIKNEKGWFKKGVEKLVSKLGVTE